MTPARTIVWRLTGSNREGMWEVIPPGWDGNVYVLTDAGPVAVRMVATGDVEWDGDHCAEVWVPEHRLPLWIAEHRVEGP